MRNYFEPNDDGSIRIYLQERDGQQLYTDISMASLIQLRDCDCRIYSRSIWGIERAVIPLKPKHVYLYRFLKGTPDGMDCDHIDGDTQNNRLSNLRNVLPEQNSQNKTRILSNSTTGIRGVSLDKPTGKFRAQAQLRGKRVYLGLYDTAEEAGRVAAEFRREHMPYSSMDQQPENA